MLVAFWSTWSADESRDGDGGILGQQRVSLARVVVAAVRALRHRGAARLSPRRDVTHVLFEDLFRVVAEKTESTAHSSPSVMSGLAPARPAPPTPAAIAAASGTCAAISSNAASAAPGQPVVPTQFSQLSLMVECARLIHGGSGSRPLPLLKPNPYVEVIVDGKPPRRTEVMKATYAPKWSEQLQVVVTPYSKVLFRVYDRSTFKKDPLIGEHSLDLYTILKRSGGVCDHTLLPLELKATGGKSAGSLTVVLDGLRVDLGQVPSASSPSIGFNMVASNSALEPLQHEIVNGGENGGVRPRQTHNGTRSVSPPDSTGASGTSTSSGSTAGGHNSNSKWDSAPKLPPLPKDHHAPTPSAATAG